MLTLVALKSNLVLRSMEVVRNPSIETWGGVMSLLFSGLVKGIVVKEETRGILRWHLDNKGVKIRRKRRGKDNVVNKKSAG